MKRYCGLLAFLVLWGSCGNDVPEQQEYSVQLMCEPFSDSLYDVYLLWSEQKVKVAEAEKCDDVFYKQTGDSIFVFHQQKEVYKTQFSR